jgi:hypothetical protein
MTLDVYNQFQGIRLVILLPEEFKRKIVQDVPLWSEFVRQEALQYDYPMSIHSAISLPACVKPKTRSQV